MIPMVSAERVSMPYRIEPGTKTLLRVLLLAAFLLGATACHEKNVPSDQMEQTMSIEFLESQVKLLNWDSPDIAAGLGEAAASTLSNLAGDEDPQVRQLSLACLDAIGGPMAIDVALERLGDPDAEIVAEAISLLHHHPPVQHDENLVKRYQETRDPFALEQIPLIAGRLAPKADARPWIRVMESQVDAGIVDNGLVTGLARMGYAPAREDFVRRVLAAQGRRAKEWIDRCAYMEDTWIVSHMIPLLDRYELGLSLNPDDPDSYLRICDLAVEGIVALTKADVGFPVKRTERYSGNELFKVKELAASY